MIWFRAFKENLKFDIENHIYLLIETEVCTGKYLPEIFVETERRRSEICAKKTECKYFPLRNKQTRLIRNLLYGSWLVVFPIFEQKQ